MGPGGNANLKTTVSARLALLALLTAERHGVRRAEILASARVSPEQLLEEDARLSAEEDRAIWSEALARTGDPLLGIEVIQTAPLGFLGLPELLFGSSRSLGEALDVARRYMPLLHEGLVLRTETSADEVRFVYSRTEEDSSFEHGAAKYFLGATVVMGRAITGFRPPIRHVALLGPAPADRAELERLIQHFGTESLEFDAREPSIALYPNALTQPSLSAAPRLHRVLLDHADELMRELPQHSSFLLRARRHLLVELESGSATASGLARRLGMSTRTMQRRLAEEGCSFADLLEDLRRELAPRYLRDRRLGLAEIAFRLGYHSPQAFHRAFHSWTGQSPGRWRRDP